MIISAGHTWQRSSLVPPVCKPPSLYEKAFRVGFKKNVLLYVWLWSGIKKKLRTLLPKTYLMGFMSGLLGFATAFTNFSAIWILHTNEIIQKTLSISWGVSKPGGAVPPLVEVFISHVSAVQHQCVHDVYCIDPTLRLALRNGCIHTTMSSKTQLKCNSSAFRREPCFLHLALQLLNNLHT